MCVCVCLSVFLSVCLHDSLLDLKRQKHGEKTPKVSSMQKDIKMYNRVVIKIDFFHTADDDCHLLVTFENSLDQDQVCVCVRA